MPMNYYSDAFKTCVACNSRKITYWKTKNYFYTQKSNHVAFTIFICDECDSGFLNPPPSAEYLKEIYQYSGHALTSPIQLNDLLEREKFFPNTTIDAKRLISTGQRYNASGNMRAMDVGSGYGFYTKALNERGYQTISINPGRYENDVFKELNGYDPFEGMFEEYSEEGKFGLIILSQTLEHIVSPTQAIQKISEILDTNGVLVCAVPNFNSFNVKLRGIKDNSCLWIPEHVNYFTIKGLERLFQQNNLKPIHYEYVTKIPYDAISKRLKLKGYLKKSIDSLTKNLQPPLTKLINANGSGLYINMYAIR